jgi:thiamine-phosphate pyrophosphorylase
MTNAGRVPAGALRLVAVTDSLHGGVEELARRGSAAVAGGATMLTLRLPGESPRVLAEAARALMSTTAGVPLLVSDRVDVALAVGAAGVHVAPDDLPATAVRRFAPDGFIIGASVGAADQVGNAAGADFVAIGPVFSATGGATSRVEGAIGIGGFGELWKACGLPAVAIGGVSPTNIGSLLAAGAAGVAVISALFGADDPMSAARALRSSLDASEK